MTNLVIAAVASLAVGLVVGWIGGSYFERQNLIPAFVSSTAETDAAFSGADVVYARLLREGKIGELQDQFDEDLCDGLGSILERVSRGDVSPDSTIVIATTSDLRRYLAEYNQDACLSGL